MGKERLLAFSDGVIAIIITIMVLELKIPFDANLSALKPLIPVLISYILSFVNIGIYWNNHHHLFHVVTRVNGKILWSNLHLLFWLSLFPFATGWMGENHFAAIPVGLYGIILLMAAIAYFILAHVLIQHHGKDSTIAAALGNDFKGKISVIIYIIAIGFSFFSPIVSLSLYIAVAIMWFIPDRRIEGRMVS